MFSAVALCEPSRSVDIRDAFFVSRRENAIFGQNNQYNQYHGSSRSNFYPDRIGIAGFTDSYDRQVFPNRSRRSRREKFTG